MMRGAKYKMAQTPDQIYEAALKEITERPEFAVEVADALRASRPKITKAHHESRLFKYHPVRYGVLRKDPLWSVIDDTISYGYADTLISVSERLLHLFQYGFINLNEIDRGICGNKEIENILQSEGSGDPDGLEFVARWWHEKGEQIFDLSQISALFTETDAGHVPFSAIKLPYESFYVYWGSHIEIASPNPGRYIDGCYVTKPNDGPLKDTIEIVFTSSFESDFPWDKCTLLCNVAHDAEGAVSVHKFLHPAENDNKEPTFRDIFGDFDREGFYPEPQVQKWLPVLHSALSMVANSLCYLSAKNAEVEVGYPGEAPARLVLQTSGIKPKERERAKRKLDALGFRRIHLCGRATAEKIGLHHGMKIPTHWRRGHWRSQRYGEKLTKIKLIWVSSVLVNADKGLSSSGHLYIADKDDV